MAKIKPMLMFAGGVVLTLAILKMLKPQLPASVQSYLP